MIERSTSDRKFVRKINDENRRKKTRKRKVTMDQRGRKAEEKGRREGKKKNCRRWRRWRRKRMTKKRRSDGELVDGGGNRRGRNLRRI